MQLLHPCKKNSAQKCSNSDAKNHTGLCTSNGSNDVQIGSRNEQPVMREQHEKEFFRLFDFAAEPKSTTADSIGSSLRVLQGAASAVFGGILSAVDTAFAILNEDMEYAADEVFPANVGSDGHDSESAIESSCDSVRIGAAGNLKFVFTSSPTSSVVSKGTIDIAPSLTNRKAMTGNICYCFLFDV